MNGHVGLSSGVVSHSGRESVRDQIADHIGKAGEYPTGIDRPKSVRELCRQITDSILGRQTAVIVATPLKSDSPPSDSPLTQEQMAVAVARDMSGKKLLSPQDRLRISTALYGSIRNMVYQLSSRYSVTCQDDVDDLAQDCMYRILTQLWRYNPRQAKFTTWTWYVCRSVLNKKYQSGKRNRSVIVNEGHLTNDEGESMLENMPERPIEGVQSHECPGIMAAEIVDAVRDLATRYPKHKQLIFEMFGNPDSDDFALPSYVSVSDAAKAVGMEYGRARVFYSTVVRPFFQKQFAGC